MSHARKAEIDLFSGDPAGLVAGGLKFHVAVKKEGTVLSKMADTAKTVAATGQEGV